MKRLLLILVTIASCEQKHSVQLTDKVDPDIVLINIQDGDRAFIGRTLLTIDSCKPKLIAIDARFVREKDFHEDSVLVAALQIVDNDILSYHLDSEGLPLRSHTKFSTHASGEGLAVVDNINGVSSHITPVRVIDGEVHELFPLKIVKTWKPEFTNGFDRDQTVPINITRTLDQFVHFDASNLNVKRNLNDLEGKVVLLGYLGPSNEDKHFTPIRQIVRYPEGQPDTYGVVLVANEIRTILDTKQ